MRPDRMEGNMDAYMNGHDGVPIFLTPADSYIALEIDTSEAQILEMIQDILTKVGFADESTVEEAAQEIANLLAEEDPPIQYDPPPHKSRIDLLMAVSPGAWPMYGQGEWQTAQRIPWQAPAEVMPADFVPRLTQTNFARWALCNWDAASSSATGA